MILLGTLSTASFDWNPNNVPSERRFVRAWRGCVLQRRVDKNPKQVKASTTMSLDIPHLSSDGPQETDKGRKCFQITPAYFPACPMTEAYCSVLSSCTKKGMTSFVLQATIPIHTTGGTTVGDNAATGAASNFVSNSKELLRKFLFACHEAFDTKKLLAHNYYFKLLAMVLYSQKREALRTETYKIFAFSR